MECGSSALINPCNTVDVTLNESNQGSPMYASERRNRQKRL
jgi:hypothetical protein